ncbi:MAG: hypothetical protein K0U45_06495 [Alphaproteobacteria bacterium]|nr:hypothetical protein [Alphaproteobacteria bacterium]
MSAIELLAQKLSGNNKQKVCDCCTKLANRQHVSPNIAKEAYQQINRSAPNITDKQACDMLISLFAKSENLSAKEEEILKFLNQSPKTITQISQPMQFAPIFNIAQKTKNQPNCFRSLSKINHFFNHLSNQTDFKKLLAAVSSVSLTSEEIAELMMAQYQSSYQIGQNSHYRNELIKKIDRAGKLSSLPEKAFKNLMNYRVSKLNLGTQQSTEIQKLITKIVNGSSLTKTEQYNLVIALIGKQDLLRKLSPKVTEAIATYTGNFLAYEQDFFKAIKDVKFSQSIQNNLHNFLAIFKKVEPNHLDYRPTAVELHKLDALYDALRKHNKVEALPPRMKLYMKAYQTLPHLSLNRPQIEAFLALEKNANANNAKALYDALTHREDYRHFPEKYRKLLEAQHKDALAGNMKKYFSTLTWIEFVKNISPLTLQRWENLLIKIEKGVKPSQAELADLDRLHDLLKKNNALDAMPNKSQALLESYQLEQEIRVKTNKLDINKLVDMLDNGKPITPFQAYYLQRSVNKKGEQLQTFLKRKIQQNNSKKIPQEIYEQVIKLAQQSKEFLNPQTLKVIEQVIEHIRIEERQLSNASLALPEMGLHLKATSQFIEARFKGESFEKMEAFLKDPKQNQLNDVFTNFTHPFWDKNFRNHEGQDYGSANRGEIYYTPDTFIKPTQAIVYSATEEKDSRDQYRVTILEFNVDIGLLLTTFHHIKQRAPNIKADAILRPGQKLGIYQFESDKHRNEHVHVERRFADTNAITKYIDGNNKILWKNFRPENGDIQGTSNTIDDVAKLVFPFLTKDGTNGGYHAVSLFMSGSALNKQLLEMMANKWQKKTDILVKAKKFALSNQSGDINERRKAAIELIMQYLREGTIRDSLKLDIITEMLIKMQTLHAEMGMRNAEIDRLIHKAKKTSLDLQDITKKKLKIIS